MYPVSPTTKKSLAVVLLGKKKGSEAARKRVMWMHETFRFREQFDEFYVHEGAPFPH